MDDTNLESEDWEKYFDFPKQRALHRAVRLDPESGWDELRKMLCRRMWRRRDLDLRTDLVSDLMFWHADAFIDRVEELAAECRHARDIIAMSHVGGRRETPGLTRYWALQQSLQKGWKSCP